MISPEEEFEQIRQDTIEICEQVLKEHHTYILEKVDADQCKGIIGFLTTKVILRRPDMEPNLVVFTLTDLLSKIML